MQELFILTIWDPVKEVFLIIKLTRMMFKNTSKTFTVTKSKYKQVILVSDILDDSEVRAVLRHPSDFIESREYFSWERFFTSLLVMKSSDTWLKYAKSKLNPGYLKGKYREEILSVLPPTLQNELREGK